MASLIKCQHCGGSVSSEVGTCPHCHKTNPEGDYCAICHRTFPRAEVLLAADGKYRLDNSHLCKRCVEAVTSEFEAQTIRCPTCGATGRVGLARTEAGQGRDGQVITNFALSGGWTTCPKCGQPGVKSGIVTCPLCKLPVLVRSSKAQKVEAGYGGGHYEHYHHHCHPYRFNQRAGCLGLSVFFLAVNTIGGLHWLLSK